MEPAPRRPRTPRPTYAQRGELTRDQMRAYLEARGVVNISRSSRSDIAALYHGMVANGGHLDG